MTSTYDNFAGKMSADSSMEGMRVFFHGEPGLRLRIWMLQQLVYSLGIKCFCRLIGLVSFLMTISSIIGLVVLVLALLIGIYIWFREYLYHAQSLSYNHWLHHNQHWKTKLKKLYKNGVKYVETGTVVMAGCGDGSIEVMWDCGYRECYPQSRGGRWESIRVYDLGPAGEQHPNMFFYSWITSWA